MKRFLISVFFVLLFATPSMAQTKAAKTGAEPGQFDFYVLALSWSPAYCADGGTKRSPEQCAAGAPKGFVVHGLWPQYEKGYPISCPTDRKDLPKASFEKAALLFPDLKLASSEWRRHGACSGLEPDLYLDTVAAARNQVKLPAAFDPASLGSSGVATLAPADIEKRFIEANPKLRPSMISVSCRKAVLREVRICFTRDLKEFRSCPEVDRAGCRSDQVSILTAP
ncbi:MAG: ribonuclease T [Alphaproteobacteria bacterium]|nr:ribonuclease T [Alphaproteobacteria bacterium]